MAGLSFYRAEWDDSVKEVYASLGVVPEPVFPTPRDVEKKAYDEEKASVKKRRNTTQRMVLEELKTKSKK